MFHDWDPNNFADLGLSNPYSLHTSTCLCCLGNTKRYPAMLGMVLCTMTLYHYYLVVGLKKLRSSVTSELCGVFQSHSSSLGDTFISCFAAFSSSGELDVDLVLSAWLGVACLLLSGWLGVARLPLSVWLGVTCLLLSGWLGVTCLLLSG